MKSRGFCLIGSLVALMAAAQLQATTTIVAAPTSVSVTYQKGTGPGTAVAVKISPSTGTTGTIYWTVDTTTLPAWLVLDKNNGTAGVTTPTTVNFSASPVGASLGAGTYTATVTIQSASLTSINIPVTLTVNNAPTQLASSLSTISTWKPGDALPSGVTLSVKSVGEPQNFTVTTVFTNPATAWFTLDSTGGIAYSWGSTINVTFAQWAFDNATIGKPLTATISVKGPNNTVAVSVSITVGAPTMTVTSILPAKLPKVASGTGTRTVAVTGTGFADGMSVKLNASNTAIANNCSTFNTATTNAICVQGPTRFFLKLTEATDLKPGTNITLNVGNATPFTIPVTTNPIIYSVTNAASFEQVASGNQTVAPYEMISIFGDNFMKLGDTAYGAVTSGRYPAKLTDSTATDVIVHFQDSTGTALTADTNGYLLFGTSTQLNLMVPSSLPSAGAAALQAVVTYGSASSDVVNLDVAAARPGIFAYSSTGQAIAVNADGTVNSSTNPAKLGTSPTYITLYVSGMGDPHDGTVDVAGGGSNGAPTGCVGVDKALTASGWTTLDGGLIDATTMVGANTLPPCFSPSNVTVTIGGKAFTGSNLTYAGWVAGSVAGLYQINVILPATPLSGMTPTATGGSGYYASVTISSQTSPDKTAIVYIK